MARGRSSGYDDQRELILGHAAALFARSGYPGTSMNEVAQACGLSKPTIYHYFRDKYALLVDITDGHMTRLQALVDEVQSMGLPPEPRLRMLIERFVQEYAHARHAHRVLTEDVRFLREEDQQRILDVERRVVAAFAQTIAQVRGEPADSALGKPLAMLLFGMINWTFTWLKPGGTLDHDAIGTMVSQLFFGGVRAVSVPDGKKPRKARQA